MGLAEMPDPFSLFEADMQKLWQLINSGKNTEAREMLLNDRAVGELAPESLAEAEATICLNLGEFNNALDILENIGENLYQAPKLLALKGICLCKIGKGDEGLKFIERALEIAPNDHNIYHNKSVMLGDMGQWQLAKEAAEKASVISPKHLQILLNYGRTLVNLRQGSDAVSVFTRCTKINVNSAEAWAGLGASYLVLNNYDKALENIKRAMKLKPESAPVNANMGLVHKNKENFELAEKYISNAVRFDPEYPEHHWNLSLIKLLRGDFESGWAEYEWRYHPNRTSFDRVVPPNIPLPMFKKGESISGKNIAIVAEQGLGDCIQFNRYAKCIKDAGGNAILFVPDVLAKEFQTLPWADAVCSSWKNTPRIDAWCFAMSLPHLFGTDEGYSVPIPYLAAYESYRNKWARKVNSTKLKVGLVWAGRPSHGNDANRSMLLKDFEEILQIPNVQFYSLQMGEARGQIEKYQDKIIDLGGEISDFSDSAGVLSNLDLLISVDSAPVHLAGALGLPAWVLISKIPDFRWGLGTADTKWYPTVKLYRQTKQKNWVGICEQLADDLRKYKAPISSEIFSLPELPYEAGKAAICGHFAYLRFAVALQNQGEEQQARLIYKWVLHYAPGNIDALRNLAVSYRRTKEYQLSELMYEKALQASPDDALTYANYCNLLVDLKKFNRAEEVANDGIKINPQLPAPYYAKSVCALEGKDFENALQLAQKASELDPNNPTFITMVGQVLLRMEDYEGARISFEQALVRDPRHPEAMMGMGQYYAKIDLPETSIDMYMQALNIRQDVPELFSNLAVSLAKLNRFDEAINYAQQAINLKPDFADAHFNRSLYLLTVGKFREGFEEYEWRYHEQRLAKDRSIVPTLKKPQWKGESLEGKTILVYTEQGFGDAIQFLGYTKILKEMGATVFVAVAEPLKSIFESCQWVDRVCGDGDSISEYHYWVPFMSIPYCLGDVSLRPYPGQYLKAQSDLLSFDLSHFYSKRKINVGIVWSGSPSHGGDKWRSVSAEYFSFLNEFENINLIALNKFGVPNTDYINIAGVNVANLGIKANDFNDLACLIDKVDLLISVDSAPVHLAGALNKKTYALIPFTPDWRWGLNTDETPIYKNTRLFRQKTRNDWDGVKAAICEQILSDFPALKAFNASKLLEKVPMYAVMLSGSGMEIVRSGIEKVINSAKSGNPDLIVDEIDQSTPHVQVSEFVNKIRG